MIMITVFWAIYFQHTLGYSPQKAGSLTFVSSLPVVFMGPVAGFLADRFTAKLPIALGFILMIFSFCYVAFFNQSPLAVLFPGLIAFGMSMPMILTPSSSTAMNSVPPHKIGSAGGMLATVRFLSGTLGVAFMGAVIDRVDQYVMQHGTSVGAEGLQVAAQVDGFFVLHLVLAACALIGFAIVFVLFKPKGERHIPTLPAEGWD
jgi:MFS family permease